MTVTESIAQLEQQIPGLKINDSHCDRIHSFLNGILCLDDVYMGKQPVAWEEYYAKHC